MRLFSFWTLASAALVASSAGMLPAQAIDPFQSSRATPADEAVADAPSPSNGDVDGAFSAEQPAVRARPAANLDLVAESTELDALHETNAAEANLAEANLSAAEMEAAGGGAGGGGCNDPKKKAALKKAVGGAYAPMFYDNNFEYLCNPCYNGWHLGEDYKRMCLGDCWSLDVGGQYRIRYHNEHNHRGLGLTGRDDQFLLHRTRLYANAEYGNLFRAYFEGIDAESNYENFTPRAIEVDRTDILNAFVDVKLHEGNTGELWARAGRQELLYGNERTASPLDWANTRRTFEGYKLMWKGEDWNTDLFWTQPVPVNDHALDSPDQSQEFLGAYSTYKAIKDQTYDFYFLRLSESSAATEFYFNTFGARWAWKSGDWLAEMEGMYQFGKFGAADHSAGAFVTGVGREFPCATWSPTLWVYYDWSSGDETIGNGYHHLFPLSHKYWGWMDLFGFRNLEDLNTQLTLKPHDKLKLMAWYHIFQLQDGQDVPYNVNMTPFTNTPGGDQDLGQELDLIAIWNITARLGMTLGYSHFFAGDFYSTNPTPNLFSGDADFYYLQMHVNF